MRPKGAKHESGGGQARARAAERSHGEAAGPVLTHLSAQGHARMVDVGPKAQTARRAVASAVVTMRPATARRICAGRVPKGDVLAAARLAGIMAAKRTPELIPLCHPLALTRVEVEISVDARAGRARIAATVEAFDRTGVEMEALVAASVAALTLYDMVKAVDRDLCIDELGLQEKSGGRSGLYRRVLADGGRRIHRQDAKT
jgi:cyclic pyranopterin phosphate synthase